MSSLHLRASLLTIAIAVTATGCSEQITAADVPPPAVLEANVDTAAFPDDGMQRLVITPTQSLTTQEDPTSVDTGSEATGSGSLLDSATTADSGIAHYSISADQLNMVPTAATLELRDGVAGYVNTSGDFVALATGSITEASAPNTESAAATSEPLTVSFGHPAIDALAAKPGVERISSIGDGTFAVTLSDPTVLGDDFAVTPDAAFGFTDTYERYQWALTNTGTNLLRVGNPTQVEDADIDGTEAAEFANGDGIIIAVVDSGVDFTHSDLVTAAWVNSNEDCGDGIDNDANGFIDDCTGWDFANGDNTAFNTNANAHGTHVAGIIAARRNRTGIAGIASKSKIMDLNVAQSNGHINGADIAAAVRYATDNGADIINLSLASAPGTSATSVQPIADAINYAATNGVLVVAAAGNNGLNLDNSAVYPASFDLPNMLIVGASTPADTVASFSNTGSSAVDLFAPGELILSTVPGNDYLFMSGTSQASPVAAATAALVMQHNPSFGPGQIIAEVSSTSDVNTAFATGSSTSARINAASAIGEAEALPDEITELAVTVSGLGQSGTVNAQIGIEVPDGHFDEDYNWNMSLLFSDDSGTYAVTNQALNVSGSGATTDSTGQVQLGNSGSLNSLVSMALPAGTYAMVIEAVPTLDPSVRLGSAHVVAFNVTAATNTGTGSSADTGNGSAGSNNPESDTDGTGQGTNSSDTTVSATDSNNGTSDTGNGASDPTVDNDQESTSGDTNDASNNNSSANLESDSSGSQNSDTTTPNNPTVDNSTPDTGGNTDASTNPGDTSANPTPVATGTGTAVNGEWEVNFISAQAGLINTANDVTLNGSFPQEVYVWFGSQPGTVVSQTTTQIILRTPLVAEVGVADITLRRTGLGTQLTLVDAYAFQAELAVTDTAPSSQTPATDTATPTSTEGSTAAPDTNTGGTTSNPSTGSTGSGSNGSSGSSGSSSDTNSDTGNSDNNTNSSGTAGAQRQARAAVGETVALSNGLTGAPITGANPAAGVTICASVCPATRVD